MKILVIGGSNFIGWRLIQHYSVTNDSLFVFNRNNHKRDYPANVRHVIGDRSDQKILTELADEGNFDVVFDMCTFNGNQASNVISALKGKTNKVIFISSAAAYLDNQLLPLKENAKCGFHPQWGAYGSAKYEAENVYLSAFHEYGFPIVIVRPSYVYGPDNTIDRETKLFDRIEKKRPILVPYSGDGVIQLGYVDDLCDALMLIAASNKGEGEIYNISGIELITLNGLISIISDIVGNKPQAYHIDPVALGFAQRDLFPFENNTYFTSIDKIKRDFGWSPKTGLEDGLLHSYNLWKQGKSPVTTKYESEDKAIELLKKNGVIR